MILPPELLRQVSAPGGGRVVLVLGAGCSVEAPTNLGGGAFTADAACRCLIADGLITESEISSQCDLAELADVVFDKFSSQRALTDRLPTEAWRQAQPNDGHKAAAAMLVEGQLRTIVTLNFDLAQQHALAELSSGAPSVSVVRGPEDTEKLSGKNLVFLHRSCEADPEQWILRGKLLDAPEFLMWENAIAAALLLAPVVVFIGLGSSARLLSTTLTRMADSVGTVCYWVDPGPPGAFFDELEGKAKHISMAWTELAVALGQRVTHEVVNRMIHAGEVRLSELGSVDGRWELVRRALALYPLDELGRKRASWLLDERGSYRCEAELDTRLIADLLASVAALADALDGDVSFDAEGLVKLSDTVGLRIPLRIASGAGLRTWPSIEAQLKREQVRWPFPEYRVVLIADPNEAPDFAPSDLVRTVDPSDLVRGDGELVPIGTTEAIRLASSSLSALRERLVS